MKWNRNTPEDRSKWYVRPENREEGVDELMVELVQKLIAVRQKEPGVAVHRCNPSTQEASLGYTARLCLEWKRRQCCCRWRFILTSVTEGSSPFPSNLMKTCSHQKFWKAATRSGSEEEKKDTCSRTNTPQSKSISAQWPTTMPCDITFFFLLLPSLFCGKQHMLKGEDNTYWEASQTRPWHPLWTCFPGPPILSCKE